MNRWHGRGRRDLVIEVGVGPGVESRQIWERNSLLAEAFCLADERVEEAKAALEEAQSERTRMLAALSVTVGNDGAVAQLLGLAERSVRLSRRRVGRGAARKAAETVLNAASEYGEEQHGETASPPWGRETTPPASTGSEPCQEPSTSPAIAESWPAAMDSLLLQGWTAGVDQQALARQLGIDLGTLVSRIQQLTTGERARRSPTIPGARQPMDSVPLGRHRRPVETRTAFTGAFAHPAGMPDAEYPMPETQRLGDLGADWNGSQRTGARVRLDEVTA
ncbi:hypothetical protein [Wenjunlia vitaminophila]|uniref:hypothetical protein n=1 Tax=Wenjunlia vitaminophila TaxID=76728 RepID=UPI0003A3C54A|nr:hypothetical protein [Wenjunlia vitaminophila]